MKFFPNVQIFSPCRDRKRFWSFVGKTRDFELNHFQTRKVHRSRTKPNSSKRFYRPIIFLLIVWSCVNCVGFSNNAGVAAASLPECSMIFAQSLGHWRLKAPKCWKQWSRKALEKEVNHSETLSNQAAKEEKYPF